MSDSCIKPIHTFYSVDISHNSLVLCDIDDTVLAIPKCPKSFYDEGYDYYINIGYNETTAKKLVLSDWDLYRFLKKPSITDKEGFFHLLARIEKSNSKLCFVTARSDCYHDKTLKDLKKINIDTDKFEIYYTNAGLKGEYIKQNINLLDYENIVFIDDDYGHLENVRKEMPYIACYKFIHIVNNDNI